LLLYSQLGSQLWGNGEDQPTDHEDTEKKYRYSYTVSVTSALDGVGGQRHGLAALPPGKGFFFFTGG